MARTYAQLEDVYQQILQDTGAATYTTTMTNMWVEDALREIALYDPHIVETIYKVESRTGTDTAGTSGSLTDTTKSQFIATTDATLEKVIHNTTDNTWAVVETASSTSVMVLTATIMASGENYEIYNKRCRNKKQIFIGDVTDYLWIDSVEYPIGTKRNWKVYGEVLEIDVDSVPDSNLNVTSLPDLEILVRFAKVHKLCQLTDLDGACTAVEPAGETTIALKSLATTEIIEVGDEFHIADQRSVYTVTTGVTLDSGAGTGNIIITPPLEFATAINDAVTFVKSTLKPQHEELFCHLVAARAVLSLNITNINAVETGGPGVWRDYQQWGELKLADVIRKLGKLRIPRRTKRSYSSG